MEIEKIKAYIERHEAEAARRKRLFEYYDHKHAINGRTFEDKTKPNNKLVHDYPRLISTTFTGYMLGEPVSYAANDEAMLERMYDCYDYNDEQAENALIALDASICGYAFEVHYIDADGIERFRRVDPVNCIAVRDDTIEENLTAVIRYYDTEDILTRQKVRTVEVYEADAVRVYNDTGMVLHQTDEREHFYNDVPVVVYRNNSRADGDFEGVISLIDAYDLMQSEGLNDQEYFSDAYMVLQGVQGTTDEDISDMKVKRTILLPNDADAHFLLKQTNDAEAEAIKNRLKDEIHKDSFCPDMTDESFAGNASGVAIRYKLWQFEQATRMKAREFKRGLQRRIELLCNIWRVQGAGSWDWRGVTINFKRGLPENLQEIAQSVNLIGNLVSDETKRALLPLEIDEEKEKERLAAEAESRLMLYPDLTDDE